MRKFIEGVNIMLGFKELLNAKPEGSGYIHGFRYVESSGNSLIIYFENGKMQISIFNGDIFRIFIGDESEQSVNTAAITQDLEEYPLNYNEEDSLITIFGEKVKAVINKANLKISFLTADDIVINEDFAPVQRCKDRFFITKLNDCIAYYGFGEKSGELNKKGYYIENYNTDDPDYNDKTSLLYKTVPFYIGLKKSLNYGIYLDNSFRSFFDMGKNYKDLVYFGADGGQVQYYFIPGEDMKEVINKYCNITGFMDMPPMWSLGYQQCRYSYTSRQETEDIAKTFREKNIPCDCIYLDIHYMDKFKVMTFDEEKFPEPADMLKKLDNEGFKVVTIVDPGVKIEEGYEVYENGLKGNHFIKKADGDIFKGDVWAGTSAFPDFSSEEARKWWKEELKRFISKGVSGIWNDMNEPAVFDTDVKTMPEDCLHNSDKGVMEHKEFHNLYGMEMSRCSKEAQEELYPNKRSFSMTRDTFAGGQKYSSVWTGDNQSTYEHMRLSIPMNCNLGLSGIGFVGNDISGFGGNTTEELFIRWMELGAFLPIFRNHSAIFTRRQEPWSFGKRAEDIAKKVIRLRYRLMPYIYNQYFTCHKQGLPVFRPMIMEFPHDENTINMYSQFMFGDKILIAPVLYEGMREKTVYLPEGEWYNYFTHEKYQGGRYYNIQMPLDDIGVFVKGGSIIPVWNEDINYIGEKEIDVTFEIFKGQGKLRYYEDDGISYDYKKGRFNLYEIESNNTDRQEVKIKAVREGLGRKNQFKFIYY